MKNFSLISAFFAALLTQSCASEEALRNIGKEPDFRPMSIYSDPSAMPAQPPLPPESQIAPDASPSSDEETPKPYANSLWQPGSRDFFKAKKARRVGDILRVAVKIDDKAKLDNETTRQRNSKDNMQAPTLLGLEKGFRHLMPGGALNPSDLINMSNANSSTGSGTIDRNEKIATEIAAVVTRILPNGNLVISGDQEVRVNYELRRVSVEGVVRPEDIASDNTVSSNLIAQARIDYGGRGNIARAQQPRIGTQLVDMLYPF
ncbi:MAG: flagellar basal body L-ring protein FlgH [Rickettsiales bacterium]